MRSIGLFNRFVYGIMPICFVVIGTRAQSAQVALDGNPETPGISPVSRSVIAGEKLLIGVVADHVEALHSYSVKIAFAPEVMTFDGGSVRLSPLTPVFIESRQGKLAAFLSIPDNDSGVVEIAAAQSGKDPSACVSGSGILGYLSFSAKAAGDPRIVVTEARLVDPDGKSIFAEIP